MRCKLQLGLWLFLAFSALLVRADDAPFEVDDIEAFSLTQKDKDAIANGLKAAASFVKFLQQANFLKLVTQIASAAGPIFAIASVVLNIVFAFIEVESPEMAQMKLEFANMNNRLDQWTNQFAEIKRKIDWSAIQMNYGDLERSIESMSLELKVLTESPQARKEIQKQIFIHKYESTFLGVAESLHAGLVKSGGLYSENLLVACQYYTENDRGQVQEFATNLFKLLARAIQIQAFYVNMKYNNEHASDYVRVTWDAKLKVLSQRMEEVDRQTKNLWEEQMNKDLDRLLKDNFRQSNQEFVGTAGSFFRNKYFWRQWFVVIYGELSGFNDHTFVSCGGTGTHRFRQNGRNCILSSFDAETDMRDSSHYSANKNLLQSYTPRSGGERAKAVVNDLVQMLGNCYNFKMVAAIAWGSNVWYTNNEAYLAYKKACWPGTGHCFNTYIFG